MGKLHGSLARAGKVSLFSFQYITSARSENKPPRLLRLIDPTKFLREELTRDFFTTEDLRTLKKLLVLRRRVPMLTLVEKTLNKWYKLQSNHDIREMRFSIDINKMLKWVYLNGNVMVHKLGTCNFHEVIKTKKLELRYLREDGFHCGHCLGS